MADTAVNSKGNLAQKIRLGGAILSIFLGIWVAMMPPPPGLDSKTMVALGITVWAVGWWITEIVPEFVTGLMMCIFWAALKCVPFKTAFSTFSTSGWWIMVGAFALGSVAGKTGLLKRISLWVLKLFPASYTGQVWGLLGSGTIISPLIPSMNAKATLSTPIAMSISDELGIERKSRAANGLFGACYVGFIIMGHMFMSGSFSHYVLVGMLPEGYRDVTWLQWLLWSLPWGVCVFVGLGLFLVFAYRPDKKVMLPPGYSSEQLAKLGPMSRDEKICLLVLIGTLLMWMTEKLHRISAGEVAIMAMCLLLVLKVMDKNDFKTRIDWTSVVFVEHPEHGRCYPVSESGPLAGVRAAAHSGQRGVRAGAAHHHSGGGRIGHQAHHCFAYLRRSHFRAGAAAFDDRQRHQPLDSLHGHLCRQQHLVPELYELHLSLRAFWHAGATGQAQLYGQTFRRLFGHLHLGFPGQHSLLAYAWPDKIAAQRRMSLAV